MGSKNKLKRFRDNERFTNVIQPERENLLKGDFEYRGRWSAFFGNENPIVLELGCGKGEYTLELARRNPGTNYLGVDIKGARIWRGAKTALEEPLPNAGFLRTHIELIDRVFAPGEVAEIWITFPDPQIKFKRTKHRMTNPDFLRRYRDVLEPGGRVHLKTDSEFMHGYTLGLLQGLGIPVLYANHDIYKNSGAPAEATGIQTFYEKQYLERGKAITYLAFSLDAL
ncbi:tRNA (guanosine(46)-N7)-methyltransferase TrmB [Robiginitalea biformata]|uniref:tRNA (guanine-N(7)-)-methyltransferase n=1 Tax=Robiginitalea biformata (strain ATCC BAA-864 / DSM 15991 / KCTC 12146 / HTCC2501) TaxID=313596 RepID=A4CJ03_ROBBH|nr:tRNA (guanosine(46)-N7)-methyltransferase TrmB [Robiginitalea biformata]EAR16911.1 tRNA (guanine-N(7)-)-methyltransferase [Robiginitalea biformata HTCC2501]